MVFEVRDSDLNVAFRFSNPANAVAPLSEMLLPLRFSVVRQVLNSRAVMIVTKPSSPGDKATRYRGARGTQNELDKK